MERTFTLSPVWLKAAVLGSIWASSEIILGSFLHNLRVPFSSILLTGIAVILVVSVSYRWNDKGLIWRAGLICAIMKAVSPSAIIFGPMAAILFESLLMELAVLVLGRNVLGFIVAGALAMSWNLFQKIAMMLIYYGFNLVAIYTSLVEYARLQLHLPSLDVWVPVVSLGFFYFIAGSLSALVGISLGKAPHDQPRSMTVHENRSVGPADGTPAHPGFVHSFVWLGFTVLGLLTLLFLLNCASPAWWFGAGVLLMVLWVYRYHGVLRPLKKIGFWITFGAITMLSALVFVKVQKPPQTWSQGLLIGLEMNFRAVLMMAGFSIIGKEMSNPVIRNYFLRTPFRQLPMALEVAFNTLPFAIAHLPSFSEIYKHPRKSLQYIGVQADIWFHEVQASHSSLPRAIIVTGNIGSGKTTLLQNLTASIKESGIPVGGILAPAIFENGKKTGYTVMNAASLESMRLSQIVPDVTLDHTGRYYFLEDAILFGKNILRAENIKPFQVVVIDEIGPLELEGKGWAESFGDLWIDKKITFLLAVRKTLVSDVVTAWGLGHPLIIDVNRTSPGEAYKIISGFLNTPGSVPPLKV